MYKKMKKIFEKIFILIMMFIILLSLINGFIEQSMGFHEITDGDRLGFGSHTFTVPDPGDAIKIPQDENGHMCFSQSTNDYEGYNRNWDSTSDQRKLYDMWVNQGSKHSDGHWAYFEVAGKPRYLVALAPIYGLVGDYVDITIVNNGEEKIYPCMIADSKDIWVDPAFEYQGKVYGHKETDGTCKIIEVCTELPGTSSNNSVMSPLLNKLKDITVIANGGSVFEHPDGPVGLDGAYTYDDGTSSNANSDADDEANTFAGALTMLCRELWMSISVFFENSFSQRNDATVLYDIKNLKGKRSGTSMATLGITDENIKAIYDEFKKNEGTRYVMDHSNLKYDECMEYYDCSSWVIHCLAHTGIKQLADTTAEGLFTEDCTKVEIDDRKPGDLIFLKDTYTTGISHVGIYMGEMTVDGEKAEWIIDTGSNQTNGVKITRYDNGWWNGEHFYAFGRLKQ